jgi:hypothetical protein
MLTTPPAAKKAYCVDVLTHTAAVERFARTR